MTTAKELIAKTMHLFGILDQTEDPQPIDIKNNVLILNDMLRQEQADGAQQFLMQRVYAQLPPGVNGQIYSFSIGKTDNAYLVQQDAVAVKAIWMNDTSLTVNRETRQGPYSDVAKTTYPSIITKWHQDRQIDGSILVTAWSPPRTSARALIEFGGRVPLISAADGSDVVGLPPEGIHDATLLLGLTISGSYGRPVDKIDPMLAMRAKAVNDRWRDWARGQQWMRYLRS